MSTEMTNTETRKNRELAEDRRTARMYRPLTDIVETEAGVSLMLEVPGAAPDAVDISLERRVLSIQARVQPSRPEGADLAHGEYGEGDYERSFTLSEDFDPERIEAEMRNGVLTITLPRAEKVQPKKIAVKAA